jgi:hypothetical protein
LIELPNKIVSILMLNDIIYITLLYIFNFVILTFDISNILSHKFEIKIDIFSRNILKGIVIV